jgi:hypothetical protein
MSVGLLPLLSLGTPVIVLLLLARGRSTSEPGRHRNQVDQAPAYRDAPRFASAPDPRFGVVNSDLAVAGGDVLPGATAGSPANVTSSATGDPFPTAGRAAALLGGHVLAAVGLLVLLLAAKPTGHHHTSHIGNSSIGIGGFLLFFAGATAFTIATSRVQRDMMGGGWDAPYAWKYISPQVVWYTLSPQGTTDAATRLTISPLLAMVVFYGLLAGDVALIAAHYLGH